MRLCIGLLSFAIMSTLAPVADVAAEPGITFSTERYARAEAMLDANLVPLVLNETITPHWIGTGADFWYRREKADGHEYIRVDSKGVKRPAFDHSGLAEAMRASGAAADPARLMLVGLRPDGAATLRDGASTVSCDLAVPRCVTAPTQPLNPTALVSPDGALALFARDHDLWLREAATGTERRLTDDGVAGHSWGKFPDSNLLGVLQQRVPLPFPPWGFSWSPDGRWLIGGRADERGVTPYPLVEHVPVDGAFRPKQYLIRSSLLGETAADFKAYAFEVATGRRVDIQLPEMAKNTNTLQPLGWSTDGKRFFTLYAGPFGRTIGILEVEVASGSTRRVLSEAPAGFVNLNPSIYNAPNVRLIKGGRELIWYSERSGWGHLYRYDTASGKELNPITRGNWVVRDILHVDEARAQLYFTAGGREAGNPYERRIYRVDLDGSDLTLLTPEPGDHTLEGMPHPILAILLGESAGAQMISPDGSVFLDTVSSLDTPAVTRLRSTRNGRILSVLEMADDTALRASGWKPPEPFTAKAADGVTDLYGVIYWPPTRGGGKLPVIDALYGGPQGPIVPHNFHAGRSTYAAHGRAALAELGFAVVSIDGRGTPQRSKAFHDAGFSNFADTALADHVAVLRQLGKRHPDLDLDRVGVYGHSFGGYISARAVLRHPDIYKVAVSSAGSHNFQSLYDSLSLFMPVPDYGSGVTAKPSSTSIPNNYKEMDNATLAANLRGHLLLAYGEMDENVYPATILQFADSLIKANRNFDLLYMPNRTHDFARDPYFIRRLWDYFVVHLAGATPPADYVIGGTRH